MFAGLAAGIARSGSGRRGSAAVRRDRRDRRRLRDRVRRRPARRRDQPAADREARRTARRCGRRPVDRAEGDDRVESLAGARTRRPVARRHHERVQHARQHGRPRRGARRDRGDVLRDRRRVAPLESQRARRRARRARRVPRVPAVQPSPQRQREGLHGRLGEPGARLRARGVRHRRDVEGRADDRRDADPAAAHPRGPDPRHDARHDRAAVRGTPDLPGRTRPHVAPARLPRAVRPACGDPARDDLGGTRRDEPHVHGRSTTRRSP